MRRYRTEIVIPADRVVGLHLPSHLPAGRAIVTILIVEPEEGDLASTADDEGHDIEWWEEFGDETDEAVHLVDFGSRLSALEAQA